MQIRPAGNSRAMTVTTTKNLSEESARSAALRRHYYRQRRVAATVNVKFFDKAGKQVKTAPPKQIDPIPARRLAGALENVLPVTRIGPDEFINSLTDEGPLTSADLFQRHYSELIYNDHFRMLIDPIELQLFPQYQKSINCIP